MSKLSNTTCFTATLFALLGASPAFADVLTVGPQGDHPEIQAAVDEALQNPAIDTVIVRSRVASYDPFSVTGPLVIVADIVNPGEAVVVNVPANDPPAGDLIRISNIGQGEQVILRGIQAFRSHHETVVLRMSSNAGNVWIEDCSLTSVGAQPPITDVFPTPSQPTVVINGCTSVDMIDCTVTAMAGLHGLLGSYWSIDATVGIDVQNSSLALWDSTVTGGRGDDAFFDHSQLPAIPYDAQPGASAIVHNGGGGVIGSIPAGTGYGSFLSGSTATGGDGGNSVFIPGFAICAAAGAGGNGMSLSNVDAAVLNSVTAQSLSAGTGGLASSTLCPAAPDGQPLTVSGSATHTQLQGFARSLSIRSADGNFITREGEDVVSSFTGIGGDLAWWFLQSTAVPGALFVQDGNGNLSVAPAALQGSVDLGGNGQTTLTATIGVDSVMCATTALVQGLFYNAGAQQWQLSSPSSLILVDIGI